MRLATEQPTQGIGVEKENIAERAAKSSGWLFGRRILVSVIRLVVVGILARHLTPAAFGLIALAHVLLQFIVLSATNGIGTHVIYDQAPDREARAQSAFWLNLALTIAQLSLLGITIPVIASFYPQPQLPAILLALAGIYFIQQLGVVPEALVQRTLDYKPLVVRDTLSDVVSAGLSLGLALRGWNVWSLVLPTLMIEPMRVVAVLYISGWRPRLQPGLRYWRQIGKYSLSVMGTNFLGLVLNDADTLLVGKLIGSGSLGYYNMAWQLSNLVGRNVSAVVASVALPALSTASSSEARLQSAYCRMLRLIATVSFPILFLMFGLASDLVQLIYGSGWEPVVVLLQIFVVFTSVRSVTSPCSVIFNVVGRPDIGFRFNLGFLPFYLAAIFVGSGWGLYGVAIGVMVVRVAGAFLAFALSTKMIHLGLSTGMAPIVPAALLAGGMGTLVWGLQRVLSTWSVALVPRVAVCLGVGGVLYLAGLTLFDRRAYVEVTHLVAALIPRGLGKRAN